MRGKGTLEEWTAEGVVPGPEEPQVPDPVKPDPNPQDPEFQEVQAASRFRHPLEWQAIERGILTAASDLGSFSAEDVAERVGRKNYPQNLIGAVIGSWRSRRRLMVVSREKSRHPEAKGRWVNVFRLSP